MGYPLVSFAAFFKREPSAPSRQEKIGLLGGTKTCEQMQVIRGVVSLRKDFPGAKWGRTSGDDSSTWELVLCALF